MKTVRAIAVFVCLAGLGRAEDDIEKLKELVQAGAIPRRRLEEAVEKQEEAKEQQILKATLYGKIGLEDLTEEQSKAMVGAAQRQWDRRKAQVEAARKLIDEGVKPISSLTPLLEDLDLSRKIYDASVSRAKLFKELAEMVKAEHELEARAAAEPPADDGWKMSEKYEGDGVFINAHLNTIEYAFKREFGKPLPVSATGETALHLSLGYDHRGRVDVAVHPDSKEGIWLRRYLAFIHVPYLAFRGAVRGQSTNAHVHIGPPSTKVRRVEAGGN